MAVPAGRLSPIHATLESLGPRWTPIHGMPAPRDFGDPASEAVRAGELALADASSFARITLKGPACGRFLLGLGAPAPSAVYAWDPLPHGGLIVRTGSAEFFLEDGIEGDLVPGIERRVREPVGGVYPVLRQDASLLLSGIRAPEALAQTCGHDFRRPPAEMVMTRVAGVSCSLLFRDFPGRAAFQIWTDASYGPYLWETLMGIVREQGGGPAGLAAYLPDLAAPDDAG